MPETPKKPWKRVTTETLIASLSPQAAAVPARQDAVGGHQARKLYQGRASFEFIKNGVFQTDGFAVLVNTHSIAECEDSEVADWICKQWNAEVKREEERLLSQPCGACGGSRLSHEARGAYDHEWVSRQDAAPYWNCPNDPLHALESYPRPLSQNMRCKVCGIAPQFTVPARQDAVPEKEKCPFGDGENACDTCKASSQPPQAAVGEGELPLMYINHDERDGVEALCVEYGGATGYTGWEMAYRRTAQLREAIAQRDEAREEISDLQGLLRTNGAALATSIYQKLDLEDRIAALDVPKPEEIERLISQYEDVRCGRNKVFPDFDTVTKVLSRLRSLPSEPGSGVQRKAVENAS